MKEEQTVASGPQSFVERLAEKLGLAAKAETVFAQPVQQNGVTVVPVAKVRWGIGGGDSGKREEGAGGGGGIVAAPAGYIEVTESGSRFKPIWSLPAIAGVVVAGGVVAAMIMKSIARVSEAAAHSPE